MTGKQMLRETVRLRALYYTEFNRKVPWVAVHERDPKAKGRVFFAKGKEAATLIGEADRIGRAYGVSQNAAFLYILDAAGALYGSYPRRRNPGGRGISDLSGYAPYIDRFAQTSGGLHSIAVVRVSNTHGDILKFKNRRLQDSVRNIPLGVINSRFDSLVRDSLIFDGIRYVERDM